MTNDKPSRADTVRQERRRKPGSVAHTGIKLSVDERKLDRKTYQYRFANDKDGRVQRLEAEDWDIDPSQAKEDTNSLGTVSSAHAGVIEGKPFNAVLMRKRKDWYEADQKEKQRPLDEIEATIRRGKGASASGELSGEGVYTPGQNVIDRA